MSSTNRHKARIAAFQCIYSRTLVSHQLKGEALIYSNFKIPSAYIKFSKQLVSKTWDQLDLIDKAIQENLSNWKQTRISPALNALLRLAVCELFFFQKTEGKIVLNEAIEICKSYVDKKATKFCNGVLHAIWTNKDQYLNSIS